MQFSPKKKRSAIKQHERVTGGGRKCPETLTQFEETVTNLIGEVPIEGHPETAESGVTNFILNSPPSESNVVEKATDSVDNITRGENSSSAQTKIPSRNRVRKRFATRRLENKINATEKMSKQLEKKLN
jgi:hypothetical protein